MWEFSAKDRLAFEKIEGEIWQIKQDNWGEINWGLVKIYSVYLSAKFVPPNISQDAHKSYFPSLISSDLQSSWHLTLFPVSPFRNNHVTDSHRSWPIIANPLPAVAAQLVRREESDELLTDIWHHLGARPPDKCLEYHSRQESGIIHSYCRHHWLALTDDDCDNAGSDAGSLSAPAKRQRRRATLQFRILINYLWLAQTLMSTSRWNAGGWGPRQWQWQRRWQARSRNHELRTWKHLAINIRRRGNGQQG